MTPLGWTLLAGVLGAAGGWVLPRLIASLPERTLGDDEKGPAVTYAAIAAQAHLAPLLAAAAGAVGLLLGWARGGQPDLAAFVVLGVLGTGMAYVDLRRHLLPDRLTVPTLLLGGALLGVAALAPTTDPSLSYPRAWACAGGLMVVYLLLALVYPAGLGLGDVKLAAPLGLYLGWLSLGAPVVGTVAAFVVGGLLGVVLLLLGRATRRSSIPFGPSMLLGALLAVLFGDPVVAWYLG